MLRNLFIFNSNSPKASFLCIFLLFLFELTIKYYFDYQSEEKELARLFHRNSKNVDYLFLGDSRIRSNINIETLDEFENLELENFGFAAASPVPQYFIFKRFLENNPDLKIRHCILGISKSHLVDIYSFRPRELYITRVLTFSEFLEVKKYLPENQIKAYYLSKLIPSYRFPDTIYFYSVYNDSIYKYPGLEGPATRFEIIFKAHNAFKALSEINMKYTENIIELCINNDIQVQLLVSPYPQSLYEEHELLNPHAFNEMDDFINQLCKKYQIDLIPMPRFLPDNNFQDNRHLNRRSAIHYTELLIDKLVHNN